RRSGAKKNSKCGIAFRCAAAPLREHVSVCLLITLALALAGCQHLAATRHEPAAPQPVQISAPGIDAAEPATASASDGTFYVAWGNHELKQADVMLTRFSADGETLSPSVRVNRQAGAATAWRGDQPSVAVAPNGAVYVLWTARVDAGDKHGTDIYLSASTDRGQTFSSEVKVNDDKTPGAHGM